MPSWWRRWFDICWVTRFELNQLRAQALKAHATETWFAAQLAEERVKVRYFSREVRILDRHLAAHENSASDPELTRFIGGWFRNRQDRQQLLTLDPVIFVALLRQRHTRALTEDQLNKILQTLKPPEKSVEDACVEACHSNIDLVARYQSGKTQLLDVLLGKILRANTGLKPEHTRSVLVQTIEEEFGDACTRLPEQPAPPDRGEGG